MDNVYMVTLKATRQRVATKRRATLTVRVTEVVEDVPVIGDDTLLDRYDVSGNERGDRSGTKCAWQWHISLPNPPQLTTDQMRDIGRYLLL